VLRLFLKMPHFSLKSSTHFVQIMFEIRLTHVGQTFQSVPSLELRRLDAAFLNGAARVESKPFTIYDLPFTALSDSRFTALNCYYARRDHSGKSPIKRSWKFIKMD